MIMVWLKFLICSLIILFGGYNLAKYGDIISEKTGLGRVWIGVLFLAIVTSLPELANGLSATQLLGIPDIAVGNLLGACLLNFVVLCLLDFLSKNSIFKNIGPSHYVTISMGMLFVALVGIGIGIGPQTGFISFLIFILYILFSYLIFKYQQQDKDEKILLHARYGNISSLEAFCKFIIFAITVIAAGIWLPKIGSDIATLTGISTSFVGTLFMALATTLPELVVAISALKIASADMAVGNLFGSIAFNMFIIPLIDIFYGKPILASVAPSHIITATAVILFGIISILGLAIKPRKIKFINLNWICLIIILLYIITIYSLYKLGINF